MEISDNSNPYATPGSDVVRNNTQEYGDVRFFSATGRLGRLRYLAYLLAAMIVGGASISLLVAIASIFGKPAVEGVGIVAYGLILAVTLTLAVRRLHDFNVSGWVALALVVPMINVFFTLALWFIPGTDGTNRFGPKTPPNTTAVTVFGILMPLLVVGGGILAAVAIPAYQQYVHRVHAQTGIHQ